MKIIGEGQVYAPPIGSDAPSASFPEICVLPTGRWLCTFRAAANKTSVAKQKVMVTWPDDEGKSWHSPVDPFAAPDGRIALVYVDRESSPVIKLRVSNDGSRSFDEKSELVIASSKTDRSEDCNSLQDAWADMNQYALGLPDTDNLPDGDLIIVYNYGQDADHTSIHWARGRTDE